MTKKWLVAAALLAALGLVLFTGAMAAYDWDFVRVGTAKYETNTYELSGNFDTISIHVATTEIAFAPSEDESCKIVCFEAENVKHSAVVQNGTLMIGTVDTRKWYDHIGVFFATPKMTVYLPKKAYASLFIDTSTGDIAIPGDFTFQDLEINGGTADAECFASVSKGMTIRLSTGDITADGLSAGQVRLITGTGAIHVRSAVSKGNFDLKTSTGAVKLTDVACKDLTVESSTGTVYLEDVVATGFFSIHNSTGDVRFENSDAARISVRTSTGNVAGTLLSGKVFITETSTGKVNVPNSTAGGKCEITTSTGDIQIETLNKSPRAL